MENQQQKPQLFTELFRPKTLDQAIILPRIKEELSKGLVDSILFYGSAGCGKTTLTRILAATGAEPLYINASLERGIDVIREKVISYASASNLFDGEELMKIVVLEECDNMTTDAWSSLRALMEQFHHSVRFIGNCNYIEKIPDPIQSRFNCICVNPLNKDEEEFLMKGYIERVKKILTACHIQYADENVVHFVQTDFPDMRSIIKKIQQLYTRGVTELTAETLGTTFDCSDIFNVIMNQPNPWENYKELVSNWSAKAEDGLLLIGQQFPTYLKSVAPDKMQKLPVIVITIAEYQAQLQTAIDKFVTLLACVYKLQTIINQ